MHRLACASAQSRQSLLCSLSHYSELEEASDKEPEIWFRLKAAHARFKVPFLMRQLKYIVNMMITKRRGK